MAAIKIAVKTMVTRAAGYAFRVYRQPNFVNTSHEFEYFRRTLTVAQNRSSSHRFRFSTA